MMTTLEVAIAVATITNVFNVYPDVAFGGTRPGEDVKHTKFLFQIISCSDVFPAWRMLAMGGLMVRGILKV